MKQIIIHIKRGCAELKTDIPSGIELVIRDYDVEGEAADAKDKDGNAYVETSYTEADRISKRL